MRTRPWTRLLNGTVWSALGTLALLGVLGAASLDAAESRIELRDGSILSGELVGVADGRYRIRTTALGEIEVGESEVLAIRPAPTGGVAEAGRAGGGTGDGLDLAGVQRQLLADPALLGAITALQTDPELQLALADPGFVQLVLSGNLEALRSDPRFLRLMDNPAIQAIVGRLGGR